MKKTIALFSLLIISLVLNFTTFANEKTIISKVEVMEDNSNYLKVSIDYIYDGTQGPWVTMIVSPTNGKEIEAKFYAREAVTRGKGNKTVTLSKLPRIKDKPFVTNLIQVNLIQKGHLSPFYSKTIDHFKNWQVIQISNPLSPKDKRAALLSDAIKLIDNSSLGGERLQLAKKNLERIILDDPKNVQAYLEMARVRMKEDTEIRGHKNSNGVTQAGKLIDIAIGIDNTYVNSYILMGYVKTLENKLTDAIHLFEKSAQDGYKKYVAIF